MNQTLRRLEAVTRNLEQPMSMWAQTYWSWVRLELMKKVGRGTP